MRTYKVQNHKSNNDYSHTTITVPREIAAVIPIGTRFEVSIDDDGLHYRPVDDVIATPAWAQHPLPDAEQGGDANGGEAADRQ